jgi:hypothetical protein
LFVFLNIFIHIWGLDNELNFLPLEALLFRFIEIEIVCLFLVDFISLC